MPFVIAALCIVAVVLLAISVAWWRYVYMPGASFQGELPTLSDEEQSIRDRLEKDLFILAEDIGPRSMSHQYDKLVDAAEFIEQSLRDAGYEPRRQEFEVSGKTVWNVEADLRGESRAAEIILMGAHYDTIPTTAGANDNGSAVVANLALARVLSGVSLERTIRFVFFVNEEMPYYMTQDMGSLRCAQKCRDNNENVIGMMALETMGYFDDAPNSQTYPRRILNWVYPTTGNFIAFVGNHHSRAWIHQSLRAFRKTDFPSQGIAAPEILRDIFRSDHAAFWHCGYPALMVTDTANFRYKYYHTPEDTADKINYECLARVVVGLKRTLLELAGQ